MRNLYGIFVHVAYVRGSLLLWQGMNLPREGAILGVFFLIDIALYSISFGTHRKTPEPIEMLFGMMSGLGLRNSVLHGVTIPEGGGQFLGKACRTSLTPMNCELDWCVQWRAHNRGTRLIASIGQVYYRP